MTDDVKTRLSRLPQLDALLRRPDVAEAIERHGRRIVASTLRAQLDVVRERVHRGDSPPGDDDLVALATVQLASRHRGHLTRVINATGVVLHTNLGRAPLSKAARDAVMRAAGYATVEFDLEKGTRSSRTDSLGELAAEAAGTPAATIVNNGAAALLLVLSALASGRDTIVSRGELVEIGGSYRLPDIMAISGSNLVEVGTTNRTRASDYIDAIGESTGMLLKVHRSNFAMVGFTSEVGIEQLAGLGREHSIPVVHDVGSGLLRTATDPPLSAEPSVETSVAAGADLVVFSGDKLLGGPQAGIIAGDEELVQRCSRHPLARAMRVDKLQRAALEATLDAHLRSDEPVEIPTIAMLKTPLEDLHARAERLAAAIGSPAVAAPVSAVVGGGALPGVRLDSWAVAFDDGNPDALATRLRQGSVPVIGRVDDGRLLLDVRTVPPSQDAEFVELVRAALE